MINDNKRIISIILYFINIYTVSCTYWSILEWDQWGLTFAFETLPFAFVSLVLFVIWFVLLYKSLNNKKWLILFVPLFFILAFLLSIFIIIIR